jgi:cobalt-zinc-cadmium resistance protein CzcA
LILASPDGARIPLAQLASITVEEGASIITRSENRRQINVHTNTRGRDQGSFAKAAQREISRKIQLPPGTAPSTVRDARFPVEFRLHDDAMALFTQPV